MRNVTINLNKKSTNQPSQKWHSLQEYTPNTPKNSSKIFSIYFSKVFPIKGISAFSSHETSLRASMTIEAAMALPIFLFTVLNILWIIEIYRLHSTLLYALHETGTKMTIYGYAYQKILDEDEDTGLEALIENVAFTEFYVRGQVNKIVGQDYISPFIHMPGLFDARFYTRYYSRAWTGYEKTKSGLKKNESMVYVTANGVAYHTSTKCNYLDLSIKEIRFDHVKYLRNASGERYYACEVCGQNVISIAYITNHGNKYHGYRNCSGLKRNIIEIPLSRARDKYKPCSGCGR